jgi:hypothetical protein
MDEATLATAIQMTLTDNRFRWTNRVSPQPVCHQTPLWAVGTHIPATADRDCHI